MSAIDFLFLPPNLFAPLCVSVMKALGGGEEEKLLATVPCVICNTGVALRLNSHPCKRHFVFEK